MKKTIVFLTFVLIALNMGCQTEELLKMENPINLKAKAWYEGKSNVLVDSNSNFYGSPDWENFTSIGGELYFPLISKLSEIQEEKFINKANMVFAKSYLILKNADDNDFEESLKIFVSPDNKKFKDERDVFGLSYLHYNSNNELIEYVLKEEGIGQGISKQNTKEVSLSARCTTYYIIQTDTYTDGSQEVMILSNFQKCDGDGGSGGNGGGSSDGDLPTADEPPPPSCKSFKFERVTSTFFEALVKNVKFKIVVIEIINGARVKKVHNIQFNQPIKFGVPAVLSNGTVIRPELAAELSAKAIKESINELKDSYEGLLVDTETLRLEFQDLLKQNQREYANGGRVNFNDMTSNLTPTEYKTSAFFDDSCQ